MSALTNEEGARVVCACVDQVSWVYGPSVHARHGAWLHVQPVQVTQNIIGMDCGMRGYSVVMFYPCLFCPSDNVWHSWRASLRALFYWYHTFSDHTTNISIKVRAPRGVPSAKQWSKLPLGQNKHGQNITTPRLHDFIWPKKNILFNSRGFPHNFRSICNRNCEKAATPLQSDVLVFFLKSEILLLEVIYIQTIYSS